MIRAAGSIGICHGPNSLAVGPIDRLIEKELHVQVFVCDNNVDQALKALKRKMQREGVFREMKFRGHYEKPLREESPGKSGSYSSRPEACPQEIAARRSAADQAASDPGAPGRGGPRASPLSDLEESYTTPAIKLSAAQDATGLSVDGGDL